jgi:hypothetical protein
MSDPENRRPRPAHAVFTIAALGFSAVCEAQSHPSAGAGASDRDVVALFLGVVLVPTLLWVVRKLLVRHIDRQMMVASPETAETPVVGAGAAEQHATHPPQLLFHDADAASAATMAPRLRRESEAKSLFNQVFFADVGFAAAYALLPLLFMAFADGTAAGLVGVLIGVALALLALMRFVLHRRQFRAFDLTRSRERQAAYERLGVVRRVIFVLLSLVTNANFSNLEEAPRMFRALISPRTRIVILMAAGLMVYWSVTGSGANDSAAARAESFGLVAAWLLHAAGFWAQARHLRARRGIRLLVLRVFNVDAASAFTFSGLTRFWRHFGNHYTVVDVSLVRQGFANSEYKTIFLVFLLWVVLALLVVPLVGALDKSALGPLSGTAVCLIVATVAALGAWVGLVVGRRRLDARFIRSREQLLARLARLDRHPRHLDLSFKHERAPCHDNTWFMAVAEFCRRADVVLMDLRGYSSERKGCQREVDFLFDVMPTDRILFLLDTVTDLDELRTMLLARWQALATTSPNLRNPAPVIHLFQCLDNDERDMQAILDWLVRAAESPAVEPQAEMPAAVRGRHAAAA